MKTELKSYSETVSTAVGAYKVVGSQLTVGSGYCIGYAHLDTHEPTLGVGATPLAAYSDLINSGHPAGGADKPLNKALGSALIFLLDVHKNGK